MWKNYLRVALRTLRKQKVHTFINVVGLGAGLAAALLIFLYARSELTHDRFHAQADRIYHVYKERITPTGTQETYDTWVPLLARLEQDFPAVAGGARIVDSDRWVRRGDRRFEEAISYADPSLFDVFTFPLARGDAARPLPELNAVVLAPEIARKYFGNEDPLGQVLTIDHATDYVVTGVLAEVPRNATIRPDLIVPIQSAPWYAEAETDWGGSFLDTYILLAEDAAPAALEAQFPSLIASIWDAEEAGRTSFKLLPLPERHEALTGSRKYAYILLGIALGIVLIACINFMNLTTARSIERMREIGMRQVLGARRAQLAGQFLGESLLMTCFALLLGAGLTQLALPAFNDLYETALRLDFFGSPAMLLLLAGLGLAVGLLSGLYPALHLSRMRPVASLKGILPSSSGGLSLRHGLLVFQFTLSILMIAATIVVWSQVRHMKTADLSFDKENIVVLPVEARDFADRDEAALRLETFKAELGRLSGVASVASSSHIPGDWGGWFTFAYPGDGDETQRLRMRLAYMDARYFDTYGIQFLAGRGFIEGSEADRNASVVLNRAALEAFGWTSAESKTVRRGDTPFDVIGVVEDYHFESLQREVEPVLHFYRPPDNAVHGFISVRLRPGDYAAVLEAIRTQWEQLDPTRAFTYFFVDENFNRLYAAQDRLAAVAGTFSVLAIGIACLGLFGLASLSVAQRTKEIGVRKVLGASVPGLVLLLSKRFALLVLLGLAAAAPVAYVVLNRWLDDFAYRIAVGPLVFALAGGLALAVALATVSYHAVRAALADPVESLRYE